VSGWFIVNTRELQWFAADGHGAWVGYDPPGERLEQLGIGLGILWPGESGARYHGEDAQEDFLILSGECLLLIEGEQRLLKTWDLVHCPPWTEHAFVGAGDGPCLVLAVGARIPGRGVCYPASKLALRHGAGVAHETTDPREAYADVRERKIGVPPAFPPI